MSRSRGLWLATSESSETGEAGECIRGDARRLARSATVASFERETPSRPESAWCAASVCTSGVWPWQWLPGHLEAWVSELRVEDHRAHSTVRSYQAAVGAFCDFVCDPAYGWGPSCLTRFGSVPSQICRAENTAAPRHRVRGTPRSSLADSGRTPGAVRRGRRRRGSPSGAEPRRAGPRPSATPPCSRSPTPGGCGDERSACSRRADFGPNPKAAEFGDYGVCAVRWGKAAKGGPPRRRGVLTVFGWSTEVLSEWIEDVWPTMATAGVGLWPSERGPLVSEDRINAAFSRSARAAGLPKELTLHCLAPQLRDPPDRRRLRRPVRSTTGGP